MRYCLLLSRVVGPGPVALLWTDPLLGAPGKIRNHLEKISTVQPGKKNYLRTINIKQVLREGEVGEGPAMLASKAVVACGLTQPRHEQPEVMRLIFGQKQFYLNLVEQIRNGILSPIVLKIPISI